MTAAGGMWGEFQGVLGRSLPEIEALKLEYNDKGTLATQATEGHQIALPGFEYMDQKATH